jgi:membrane protease YdiL (CAAX protease family)
MHTLVYLNNFCKMLKMDQSCKKDGGVLNGSRVANIVSRVLIYSLYVFAFLIVFCITANIFKACVRLLPVFLLHSPLYLIALGLIVSVILFIGGVLLVSRLPINKEILLLQISSPQPSWLLIFIFLSIWLFLPLILKFLLPQFSGVINTVSGYQIYRIIYFVLIASIVVSWLLVIYKRFYSLLANNQNGCLTSMSRIFSIGLLCGTPFIIYSLILPVLRFLFISYRNINHDRAYTFVIHLANKIWQQGGWGTDSLGILLGSLTAFVSPIYEESLFNGCLLPKFASRMNLIWATLLTASLFVLLHVPVYGFSSSLAPVFLSGILCCYARLLSGSWVAALITHWIFNLTVFAPKWAMLFPDFFLRITGA